MGTSKNVFECKSNNNNNKNKISNYSYNSNNNKKKKKENDEKMVKNEDVKVKKGVWSVEEDQKLIDFISSNNGDVVNWRSLPHLAGILRCGKSCRLRWTNYLRPDINRGPFTPEECKSVVQLHALLGNRWSAIAARLPGRTDNDVKNFWNTHLRKKQHGLIRRSSAPPGSPNTRHTVQWESIRLETEARLSLESAYYPFGYPVQSFDPFLHLWYSETGASFREFGRGLGSSTSENCSEITGNVDQATEFCVVKDEQMSADDSEENGSDTALDVLLDSPTSD